MCYLSIDPNSIPCVPWSRFCTIHKQCAECASHNDPHYHDRGKCIKTLQSVKASEKIESSELVEINRRDYLINEMVRISPEFRKGIKEEFEEIKDTEIFWLDTEKNFDDYSKKGRESK